MEEKDQERQVWYLARGADEEAFNQVRCKYKPLVSAEIHKRLQHASNEDLRDLEQEVWISVWTALPTYRGTSALPTWIAGVTKNRIFSWLRHQVRERRFLDRVTTGQWITIEECWQSDITNYLTAQDAIESLVPTEHEVIYLRYFEQLSDAGISQRLGIPLGTVKSRIRAGLTHLRKGL